MQVPVILFRVESSSAIGTARSLLGMCEPSSFLSYKGRHREFLPLIFRTLFNRCALDEYVLFKKLHAMSLCPPKADKWVKYQQSQGVYLTTMSVFTYSNRLFFERGLILIMWISPSNTFRTPKCYRRIKTKIWA